MELKGIKNSTKDSEAHVLFLTNFIFAGGTRTYAENLLHELHHKKIRTTCILYVDGTYTNDLDFLCSEFITIHKIYIQNPFSLLSIPERLYKTFAYILFIKVPTLILSDLFLPQMTISLIRFFWIRLRSVPLIYQFHGIQAVENAHYFKWMNKPYVLGNIKFQLEKLSVINSDHIIFFSKYARNLLVSQFGYERFRTKIVPPGIDWRFLIYNKFSKAQARKILGFSRNIKIVLIVSRIEPRKGVDTLIKALNKYEGKQLNTKYVLVSNFSYVYYDIFKILSTNNLNNAFIFVHEPDREQLSRYYRAADITLITSEQYETFGFPIIESLYFQTPVFGFNTCANSEIIPKENVIQQNDQKWINLFKKINKIDISKSSLQKPGLSKKYSWSNYVNHIMKHDNYNNN